MLQCGGCKRAPVRSSWREGLGGANLNAFLFPHRICDASGFGGAVAVPTLPTSWATDLPDSGIEAGAIADWMEAFAASNPPVLRRVRISQAGFVSYTVLQRRHL